MTLMGYSAANSTIVYVIQCDSLMTVLKK